MRTCMDTRPGKSPNPSWRYVFSFHSTSCVVQLKARVDTCSNMWPGIPLGVHILYCCIWGKCVATLQGPRLGLCTARKAFQISSTLRKRLRVCVFCRPADLCCECGLRYTPCRLARRVQRTCGFGVRMSNCWRSSAVESRRLRWQRRPYRCCR